jgi:DNA-binding NtrC family response regulator
VLQQGEYTTVGGRTPIKTDVRIVAATNKDLRILIQQGLFREDLFFRLNVVPLRLPPLRERIEDVPDLIRHFFTQAEREGLPPKQLDQAALERVKRYRWPGNVRELENLARRLAALGRRRAPSGDLFCRLPRGPAAPWALPPHLAGDRASAPDRDPGGDQGQSDPRCRPVGGQPQYVAQKDPRPGNSGVPIRRISPD